MKKTLAALAIALSFVAHSAMAAYNEAPNVSNATGSLQEAHGGTGNTWMSRPIKIWAHRGYAATFPQNTLYAFKQAIAMGLPGNGALETDVQMTSDGYAVLFHDATLDSLTDCTGSVASHTWEEIQACNIDNAGITPVVTGTDATKIPLFSDLVTLAKNTRTPIIPELKAMRTTADVATVMDIAINAGVEDLTTWQCDSFTHCTAVRAKDPSARFVYFGTASTLANMKTEIDTVAAYKGNVGYFNTMTNFINNPTIVSYAYGKNVDVGAYTATTTANITSMAAIGVRNIFSNIPYYASNGSGASRYIFAKTPQTVFSGAWENTDIGVMAQNTSSTGMSGFVSQNNDGTKYLSFGMVGSGTTLSADYGAANEGTIRSSSGASGLFINANGGSGYVRFATTGTERARINASGLLIATTTAVTGAALTVNGAVAATGGSENHAVCWKSTGILGYCSAVVAADGTCGTCN